MFPARYHREIPQRYRLEAAKCKRCGAIYFPPRLICAKCKNREFETVFLSDEGKIVTFTVISVAPSQFSDEVPYVVGIVELDGGVRVTTQIVDCDFDQIEIGKKARLEFRRIQEDGKAGILCYGHKAVLV
ncbi:MAG: Zn-ribbon domain-containing OB-fold protein [Candidatus Edwardsbacteria bacterium]